MNRCTLASSIATVRTINCYCRWALTGLRAYLRTRLQRIMDRRAGFFHFGGNSAVVTQRDSVPDVDLIEIADLWADHDD